MAKRRELIQILCGMIGILTINFLFGIVCALLHASSVLFTLFLSAIGFAQILYVNGQTTLMVEIVSE